MLKLFPQEGLKTLTGIAGMLLAVLLWWLDARFKMPFIEEKDTGTLFAVSFTLAIYGIRSALAQNQQTTETAAAAATTAAIATTGQEPPPTVAEVKASPPPSPVVIVAPDAVNGIKKEGS